MKTAALTVGGFLTNPILLLANGGDAAVTYEYGVIVRVPKHALDEVKVAKDLRQAAEKALGRSHEADLFPHGLKFYAKEIVMEGVAKCQDGAFAFPYTKLFEDDLFYAQAFYFKGYYHR